MGRNVSYWRDGVSAHLRYGRKFWFWLWFGSGRGLMRLEGVGPVGDWLGDARCSAFSPSKLFIRQTACWQSCCSSQFQPKTFSIIIYSPLSFSILFLFPSSMIFFLPLSPFQKKMNGERALEWVAKEWELISNYLFLRGAGTRSGYYLYESEGFVQREVWKKWYFRAWILVSSIIDIFELG